MEPALQAFAERFTAVVGVAGYSPWTEPDRHALARAHAENDVATMTTQLTGLTLEDPDWRWAQDVCLDLVHAGDPTISIAAVTGLTNLTFLRRQLDREQVAPVLRSLQDPAVAVVAAAAVGDFFDVLDDSAAG